MYESVWRLYKELLKCLNQNTSAISFSFHMRQKTCHTHTQKKMHKWPISTWENAWHHQSWGKCKSNHNKTLVYNYLEWVQFKRTVHINGWQGCKTTGTLVHFWMEGKMINDNLENSWTVFFVVVVVLKLNMHLPKDLGILLLGI